MELLILLDYKNNFGSKYDSSPYRSGMDKRKIAGCFLEHGIEVTYMSFYDIDLSKNWENKIVLYTSSEDTNLLYKSYIEDVVYGLELAGAVVIPRFKYLRAHHNKVLMEIIRNERLGSESGLSSLCFGTLEEVINALEADLIKFPCVVKRAAGAMSRGVSKADNASELLKEVKKASSSLEFRHYIHDRIRKFIHKGYIRESRYRNKFIVQPMIENLINDWKILIFWDQLYSLKRYVRKGDFRASGSHVNYKAGSKSELPYETMEFAWSIYQQLDVPMISMDIAYDGKRNYLLEFQTIYFGTSTHSISKDYYVKEGENWKICEKSGDIESSYVHGVVMFLGHHNLL
jgi:hypothetical protein